MAPELQTYQTSDKSNLLEAARMRKQGGWHLAQISVTAKESYDLLYSFERDDEMMHLRITLAQDEWVSSVSGIFPYAYLYENEMKDLFGIDVRGINLDFKGELYQTSVKAPFQLKPTEGGVDAQNG